MASEVAELFKSFEDCRFEHDGAETWRARHLMKPLGYTTWDKGFREVIRRAWEACEAAKVDPAANFLTGDGTRPWTPTEVFREASKNPLGGAPSEPTVSERPIDELKAIRRRRCP